MAAPSIGAVYGGQHGTAGGLSGSQPRSAPEDYMPGDERPGQRSIGRALRLLAAARDKKGKREAFHHFLNTLGERQGDTIPAAQNSLDAGGAPGDASTFFGH